MELSVVIVSYQGRSLLEQCLRSIASHLDGRVEYEIRVVDNASTDGTVPWLRRYAAENPRVTPVFNDRNAGFAAGNNAALRHCRGEFILLLNNDALLIDTSVTQGIDFLRRHPEAFGAGGLLLNGDGTRGPSYGHFPGPRTLAREVLGWKFGALRAVVPAEDEGVHHVDFPCGAFFLVNATFLENVGYLDERFFLYYEETDWALRAWRQNRPIYYLPFCKAVHLGGGSSKNREPLAIIATFYESWLLYLRKHSGFLGIFLVSSLLLFFLSVQAAKALLRGRGRSFALHAKHMAGLVWGFLGKPSRVLSSRPPRSTETTVRPK